MNSLMDIFNIPFGYLLRFCYKLIPNYAIALLLFALAIKIVLFPLGIKQQKNMQKQASLRPKEMAIRNKYAGRTDQVTQQKQQQELMELYKRENYSPLGGCLPLLIQFPVIIALYNVIRNPLTYLLKVSKENVTAIGERIAEITGAAAPKIEIDMITTIRDNFDKFSDLLGEGVTVNDLPSFTVFKVFDLGQTPSFSNANWLLLIPILTFAAVFVSMKLTKKFSYQPPMDNNAGTNISLKIMDYTMPLMSTFITFSVPAVIGLYWIYQNLLGTVQQYILSKILPCPTFTDEDYKRIEKEMNGKVSKKEEKAEGGEKKPVKSLHSIDENDDITIDPELEKKRAPELKEDRGTTKLEKKGEGKKPVKSLHFIDADENENK